MKFFEFVACCGAAVSPVVRPDSPPHPVEEKLSLVRSPPCRRRRKRGRLGVSGSALAPAEWRPSLCSISEESVMIVERSDGQDHRHKDRTARSKPLVKRKSGSRSSRPNGVASFGDAYRRSSFPTVIPAFPPTPFMF